MWFGREAPVGVMDDEVFQKLNHIDILNVIFEAKLNATLQMQDYIAHSLMTLTQCVW